MFLLLAIGNPAAIEPTSEGCVITVLGIRSGTDLKCRGRDKQDVEENHGLEDLCTPRECDCMKTKQPAHQIRSDQIFFSELVRIV